ncbi:MAG: sulfatase [Nitrospirae bacterium]|nr:sulfatase [Nitrospirota bacterium]
MKPNIILISIDTLRADHLSCYGYSRPTTPNIDKLASEGTIYRQNYSTGVWTPPGHASMLTGLYLHEHGVYDDRRLADQIPTIATVLKENGYQTAGFVSNSQVGELVGFHKGHDVFEEVWKGICSKTIIERIIRGITWRIKKKLGHLDMGAKRTNELVRNWLEQRINKGKPFYAFLHYIEAHNPLSPPRSFKNKFLNIPDRKVDMDKINKIANNPLICYVEDLHATSEEIEYLKGLYDGEIAYIDGKIGEVVNILKENRIYDDTMLIITADHGEHFGEHGMWSHVASLHKEVLHIPLIIKYPGGTERIKEVTEYTQLVDIFPTVMEIAGLTDVAAYNGSGVSLVCDKENEVRHHEYVFAEWEGRIPYFILEKSEIAEKDIDLGKFKIQMSAIQDKQYKYIMRSDGTEELYDISDGENKIEDINIHQKVREIFQSELLSRKMTGKEIAETESIAIDDEIAKNLKALGYM